MAKLNYVRNPKINVGGNVDLTPINNQITAINNKLTAAETKLTATETKLNTAETKITNLGNITVKNNLSGQTIPQQRITENPGHPEHIWRLQDQRTYLTVNHAQSPGAANTVWSWTHNNFTNGKINVLTIKFKKDNISYCFDWSCILRSVNELHIGPTYTFSNGQNLNDFIKVSVFFANGKFNMICNTELSGVWVYVSYLPFTG